MDEIFVQGSTAVVILKFCAKIRHIAKPKTVVSIQLLTFKHEQHRPPRRPLCKNDICIGLSPLPQQSGEKGRTQEELHEVIQWLTGFSDLEIQQQIDTKASFEKFFQDATLHPNAALITGLICGYRVEEIENPLTQKVRYLDKLVDELAKGKKMVKILVAVV